VIQANIEILKLEVIVVREYPFADSIFSYSQYIPSLDKNYFGFEFSL
jgi:hypothetical protein